MGAQGYVKGRRRLVGDDELRLERDGAGNAEQGYIVRTRADDDTVPDPSVARREIALASGAQIVHTDYPPGEPRFNTGYQVTFGTKVASRCNPVTTTAGTCTAAAVIEP